MAGLLIASCSKDKDEPNVPVGPDEPTTVAVTGVSINKTSVTLLEGNTETVTATVSPEDASDKGVTWKSSDPSVATVDSSGKITAVAPGEAVITVTTTDGEKTATVKIVVTMNEFTAQRAVLKRIPRMGRRIAFEKTRFARASTPPDARPALLWTKAVKASSPNASMLMK